MAIISETIRKAVENKDVMAIRSSIYTVIMSDPAFETSQFDETLDYVKEHKVEDFIDVHNGENLIPEAEWDETYLDMLISKLLDNFSEERIEQIKTVSKKIYTAQKKKNMNNSINVSSNSRDDYSWLVCLGAIVVIILVLKRLFRRK